MRLDLHADAPPAGAFYEAVKLIVLGCLFVGIITAGAVHGLTNDNITEETR